MPELKITAVDTSLAMDEVEKKLGPDALILSTTRRDGMIEILATNEPEQIEAANLKAVQIITDFPDAPSPFLLLSISQHLFAL